MKNYGLCARPGIVIAQVRVCVFKLGKGGGGLRWLGLIFAAPATPTTFAAQSVGQLTHAIVYLTHFPVALIQHATDPNTEAH